jgi:hypothetical protein
MNIDLKSAKPILKSLKDMNTSQLTVICGIPCVYLLYNSYKYFTSKDKKSSDKVLISNDSLKATLDTNNIRRQESSDKVLISNNDVSISNNDVIISNNNLQLKLAEIELEKMKLNLQKV